MSLLDTVRASRAAKQGEIDSLLATVESESRSALTTEEDATFANLISERDAFDARITQLETEETRRAAAASAVVTTGVAASGFAVTSEPTTYRRGDHNTSYFRDLFNATAKGSREARERLERSDKELRAGATTVAGAGGEFAPPAWMIADFVAVARPGRPFADALTLQNLPAGISSINLPRIATGATVAAQTTQNTAVSNTDATTTSVTDSIHTLAGYVLVSQQELDQSPVNFDEIILSDLAADYAAKLDLAVITALAGTAGINAQTYTDASPTTAKVNLQVAQAIAAVHKTRYLPPSHIVMSPDRWGKFLSATDTAGRPFVVANPAYGAFNANGVQTAVVSSGVAGTLQGLPVIVDASIPTNLGGGTNQDEIFVVRASDNVLYESTPRAEALPQTYGNQLSVLCRFYNYYSLLARLPKAIAVISGTGLVTTLAYGS